MEFFIDESCGYCTPCRVGNILLRNILNKIIEGKGETSDLKALESLSMTIKAASRCGLGQSSANPIITSLKNFRPLYEKLLRSKNDGLNPAFDISKALKTSEIIAERKSAIFIKE